MTIQNVCYCNPYISESNKSITFKNDSLLVHEQVFFMKPTCDEENSYQFGGVCLEARVDGGAEVIFANDGETWAAGGFFGYGSTPGVILARISGMFSDSVQAVFLKEGEAWKTSDFRTYSALGNRGRWIPNPERVWDFPVDEFRTFSNNKELFRRLGIYNNPAEYERRI